jgi:hypothetical protein
MMAIGIAHFLLGDDKSAIRSLNESIELNSSHIVPYVYLAAAHALTGGDAQVREAASCLRRVSPGFTIERFFAALPSSNEVYVVQRERLRDGLRRAGLPEQ